MQAESLHDNSGLAAIGVGGGLVVEAIPGVASGVLGAVPFEVGLSFGAGPAPAQVGFDFVKLAAGVALPGFPAVLIGGAIFIVRGAGLHIGTAGVVGAPVFIFDGRVDGFGDGFASKAAGDSADHRADRPTGDGADAGDHAA